MCNNCSCWTCDQADRESEVILCPLHMATAEMLQALRDLIEWGDEHVLSYSENPCWDRAEDLLNRLDA